MDIEQRHAAGKQCRLDKSRAAPRRTEPWVHRRGHNKLV
jgi:hypothetical protein